MPHWMLLERPFCVHSYREQARELFDLVSFSAGRFSSFTRRTRGAPASLWRVLGLPGTLPYPDPMWTIAVSLSRAFQTHQPFHSPPSHAWTENRSNQWTPSTARHINIVVFHITLSNPPPIHTHTSTDTHTQSWCLVRSGVGYFQKAIYSQPLSERTTGLQHCVMCAKKMPNEEDGN